MAITLGPPLPPQDAGAITPNHRFNADQVLPIGSNFKLWIIGALAMQVAAGTLEWEPPVEIQEKYISVPGGDLRYVKQGTTFTLRYLAERMIQKSDNTATDHMLFLAGRENVEQAMTTMGVSDPARNIPLLSTRELTMLKFAYPKSKVDAYYAAGEDERRRILAEDIDTIPYEALSNLDQTKPIEIDVLAPGSWLLAPGRSTHAWLATGHGNHVAGNSRSVRRRDLALCRLHGRVRAWSAQCDVGSAASGWPLLFL